MYVFFQQIVFQIHLFIDRPSEDVPEIRRNKQVSDMEQTNEYTAIIDLRQKLDVRAVLFPGKFVIIGIIYHVCRMKNGYR